MKKFLVVLTVGLVPSLLWAATYIVLWENYPGIFVNKKTGNVAYPHQELQYVDSFTTLEACRARASEDLEQQVVGALIEVDTLQGGTVNKKQTEQDPYAIKRVLTDGELGRDAMGLVPLDAMLKPKWIRKPTYLTIIRNDDEQVQVLSVCAPATIDPRTRRR